MNGIDPRIPSVTDPFDIRGCAQLPFPLTPEEDAILKRIIHVAASDDQMYARAYEAIVCIWAKKAAGGGPVAPVIATLTPAFGGGLDNIVVDISGTGFDATSKVYFKGFPHTPTSFVPGTVQHLFVTINVADLKRLGGQYPIYVVNQYNLISNSVDFQVNTHTPVITTISPTGSAPDVQVTITVNGDHFDSDSYIHFNGNIINNPADVISRTRTQLVARVWMPPISPFAPTIFVASGVTQIMSVVRTFGYIV